MGSKSPQRFGFTNRFTVVVTLSTLILIIGLCCAVESKVSTWNKNWESFCCEKNLFFFRMCGLPSEFYLVPLIFFFRLPSVNFFSVPHWKIKSILFCMKSCYTIIIGYEEEFRQLSKVVNLLLLIKYLNCLWSIFDMSILKVLELRYQKIFHHQQLFVNNFSKSRD